MSLSFEDIYEELKNNPEEILEYGDKIDIPILKNYLSENIDSLYDITIEGKEYHIRIKDIINFMTLRDYHDGISIYSESIRGVPIAYFLYAVLSFFNEKINDLGGNYGEIIQKRLDIIAEDKRVKLVNECYKSNDPNLERVSVNPELKDAIFKDMPSYYRHGLKETLAIFIYLKLCKLLTYDDEFLAENQTGEAALKHEDINHIREITPSNNKVVCYEIMT